MVRKTFVLIVTAVLCFGLIPANSAGAVAPNLLITEIQVGVGNERNEFVEIYNPASTPVTVESLRIEYLSSSFSGDLSSQTRTLAIYSGIIEAKGLLILRNDLYSGAPSELLAADRIFGSPTDNPTTGFLAYSGGYVRLVSSSSQLVDCVRWGGSESSTISGCQRVASPHTSDQNSLQRPLVNGEYKTVQGIVVSTMTPRSLINTITQPEPDINPDPVPDPPAQCLEVLINEVLPNPAGDDAGQEYVELFNSTNGPIDVSGCILKVGSSQQILSGVIEPGYKVFYGINLPNAAGGVVSWGSNTDTVNQSYPPGLGDDEAYGVFGAGWQQGLIPTPGTANKLKTSEESVTSPSVEKSEACSPGKYRNPETNRCRNIEAESSLTPCGPGQVRNPETNRCRNANLAASTLVACKPDETRNPDTNRCRKNTATGSTLTSCKDGYERNSETNRCRKVAAAKTTNPMASTSKGNPKPISYMVLGLVGLIVVGYGVYEYRQSIFNLFTKRRRSA